MFDFPQPGEIYRSAGFPDVAVVGILEDGIPSVSYTHLTLPTIA